jgi:hypothetical protein
MGRTGTGKLSNTDQTEVALGQGATWVKVKKPIGAFA